jgi:hypothetical protein
MHNAPVILFVYNRPLHLSRTLEYLRLNDGADETTLYIFAEGPKSGATSSELEKIKEVRRIIHEIKGFKRVVIQESETNIGCAASMTSGISKVMKEHGRGIILEDDILTHPNFLSYCNKGLEIYKNNSEVKQIAAFMFPGMPSNPRIFFSRAVLCWGWATWDRAWNEMSMDAKSLLSAIKSGQFEHEFDLGGIYPYTNSLIAQAEGKIDAWDICWYASLFLQKGLSVYPSSSLTQNTGMDGSGTHFKQNLGKKISPFHVPHNITDQFPSVPVVKPEQEAHLHRAIYKWHHLGLTTRLRRKLNNVINILTDKIKE